MSEKKFFRLIEKKGRVVLADLDNNILQPHEAMKLANDITRGINTKSYVYIGLRHSDGLYKIGLTDNVERRRSELGIELLHTIECDAYGDLDARTVEAALHKFFATDRIEGEWFRLIETDVALIKPNSANGEATLKFLREFSSAHDYVLDLLNQSAAIFLADWVGGALPTYRHVQAAYYTTRKSIARAQHLELKELEVQWQFCLDTALALYSRNNNCWRFGE